MDHRRICSGAAVAFLVTCVLAGCGLPPMSGWNMPVVRESGDGDEWSVGVRYPIGDLGDCHEDDAVTGGVVSFDEPTSWYGLTLARGSDESDVDRIIRCLRWNLTGQSIVVSDPSP